MELKVKLMFSGFLEEHVVAFCIRFKAFNHTNINIPIDVINVVPHFNHATIYNIVIFVPSLSGNNSFSGANKAVYYGRYQLC